MATAIKVPNVGESVTEVTLSKWLVNEGDYVEVDQEICELESDKATLELPAEVAGRIHLIAKEGEDLEIGALIAEIDESAAKPEERSSGRNAQRSCHSCRIRDRRKKDRLLCRRPSLTRSTKADGRAWLETGRYQRQRQRRAHHQRGCAGGH